MSDEEEIEHEDDGEVPSSLPDFLPLLPAPPFDDPNEPEYMMSAEEAIRWMYRHGVMIGFSESEEGPGSDLTFFTPLRHPSNDISRSVVHGIRSQRDAVMALRSGCERVRARCLLE